MDLASINNDNFGSVLFLCFRRTRRKIKAFNNSFLIIFSFCHGGPPDLLFNCFFLGFKGAFQSLGVLVEGSPLQMGAGTFGTDRRSVWLVFQRFRAGLEKRSEKTLGINHLNKLRSQLRQILSRTISRPSFRNSSLSLPLPLFFCTVWYIILRPFINFRF